MSDQMNPMPPAEPAVDPVAAARAVLASQTTRPDDVESLRKQVRGLWILSGVTAAIVVLLVIFTLLPRFGVRTFGAGNFGNRGNFVPGQQQQGGQNPGGTTRP